MEFVRNLYKKERAYVDRLSYPGKQLMKSIFLYNFISPLFSLFLNALLFRQTESLILTSLFNLCLFAAVTFGFYLNGIALKRYPMHVLFILGLVSNALVLSALIFMPTLPPVAIVSFGLLYGLSTGVYWANRNFLTLRTTTSDNRMYFSSLESVSKSFTDVVIPFVIGGFIHLITIYTIYPPLMAYKLLSVIMFVLVVIISMQTLKIQTESLPVSLFVKKITPSWTRFRQYNFILGFLTVGNIILPALLVLILVGDEGALGTVQSLAALISAFVVYNLSKKLKQHHRLRMLQISICLGIIGGVGFAVLYSAFGAFLFITMIAVSTPLWWAYMSSMSYDMIDGHDLAKRYAGVCDREIFINLGRVIALSLFIGTSYFISDEIALRYIALGYAFFQMILFFVGKSIENTTVHRQDS